MAQVYWEIYFYVILHLKYKQSKIFPRSEPSSREHEGKEGLLKYHSPVQAFDVNFIDSLTNPYPFSNQNSSSN